MRVRESNFNVVVRMAEVQGTQNQPARALTRFSKAPKVHSTSSLVGQESYPRFFHIFESDPCPEEVGVSQGKKRLCCFSAVRRGQRQKGRGAWNADSRVSRLMYPARCSILIGPLRDYAFVRLFGAGSGMLAANSTSRHRSSSSISGSRRSGSGSLGGSCAILMNTWVEWIKAPDCRSHSSNAAISFWIWKKQPTARISRFQAYNPGFSSGAPPRGSETLRISGPRSLPASPRYQESAAMSQKKRATSVSELWCICMCSAECGRCDGSCLRRAPHGVQVLSFSPERANG